MSTTACCPPPPLPLHRPWLRRLLQDWRDGLAARRAAARPAPQADYGDLAHLSEQTLRDIGAPDWVHERERGAALWQLERVRW